MPSLRRQEHESENVVIAGTARIPVILIDFFDQPADAVTHRPGDYRDMLFQKAYPYGNGSMRDYFLDQSGGLFDVTGDVTPSWLRLPRTLATYAGSSFGYQRIEPNDFSLVKDAVVLADPLMNFCDFDTNGDGYVDSLFVVHAGPGAEETRQGLWSLKWSLPSPVSTTDICATGRSVAVKDFTIEPEGYASDSFTPEGAPRGMISAGIFIHEFGHVLGLPDLYDTDYSSPGGVGPWDVMATGTYGFDGRRPWRPTPLSAWSKIALGWARPQDVTQNLSRVPIPASESAHQGPFTGVYRLFPDGEIGSPQHLLVENRQMLGWAADFPTNGLAIWQVDSSKIGNAEDSQRLLSLVQADGLNELGNPGSSYAVGDAGDLFPGATGARGFSLSAISAAVGSGSIARLAVWAIGNPDVVTLADLYVTAVELPPLDEVIPPTGQDRDRPLAETTPTPVLTPLPSPLDGVQPKSDELAPEINHMSDAPDPFAPGSEARRKRAAIHFSLSENAVVTIAIKRNGRLVRFLLRAQPRRRGRTAVVWSGRDRNGQLVRPGTYVYVITAKDAQGNKGSDVRGRIEVRRR
ncbi:MAG: M6 family metalloprotease domain-containing protein [Actinomycetota bacterium]